MVNIGASFLLHSTYFILIASLPNSINIKAMSIIFWIVVGSLVGAALSYLKVITLPGGHKGSIITAILGAYILGGLANLSIGADLLIPTPLSITLAALGSFMLLILTHKVSQL